MKTIPVDCTKLSLLVAGPIQPATAPDGTPRRDRAGRPLYNVPVVVMAEGGNADTMTVRVPGPVPQLPPLTPVRLTGLVARPWAMEGRSGVSFAAEAVQPVNTRS